MERCALIFILGVLLLFGYIFIYLYLNKTKTHSFISVQAKQLTSTNLLKTDRVVKPMCISCDSYSFSLDSQCQTNVNDTSSQQRNNEFNKIFTNKIWGNYGSRSGPGSTLEGTYDWIKYLRSLFEQYSIRSLADIPCGDTYWQFSLREINAIDGLYFGGDISTNVIAHNQKLYHSKHKNKIFHYWDLVRCPIPTYSFTNQTYQSNNNSFDLIIVRDALQHMHIRNGLKAVRNVILSGAKYFALTSYPPNGKSSAANTRSIGKNESLPAKPIGCETKDYCKLGQINDGSFYANNINCPPFNFSLNKAILIQPSHVQFKMESDEIHIYEIDEELKQIVKQYDKACS